MSTGFGNVVVTPNFFRRSAWLGAILASFTTSGWLGGSLNAAFASFFMVGIDKQAQALSFKSSSTRKLGPNLLCILKLSILLFYLFFWAQAPSHQQGWLQLTAGVSHHA